MPTHSYTISQVNVAKTKAWDICFLFYRTIASFMYVHMYIRMTMQQKIKFSAHLPNNHSLARESWLRCCDVLPYNHIIVKFVFFEKATKFDEISVYFWPINLCSLFPATVLNSSLCLSGSQSWNLIHWDGFWSISCLSVSNIPNIAKTWQCLECLSNLLKIQNWAGNTEKQVIGQKLGEDFTKFCGLLRIYEL